MAEVDRALARLTRAVDGLERALLEGLRSRGEAAEVPAAMAALEAERDRLAARVVELEAQAERDAELRTEATAAVKAALEDLRALMPGDGTHG